MRKIIKAVPTNVITGFLGVGKTTLIQYLLKTKPNNERWAVLVNEFGEVGLDAHLLGAVARQENDVFIREVPGGCMCCASGLPMQVALNQLIASSDADRLLIEPTGLGHPREVIKVLSQPCYQGVLDLKATLTLVDARKITDIRYAQHETFKQQLQIADVILASKQDLYSGDDLANLKFYVQGQMLGDLPLHKVTQGQVKLEWLDRECAFEMAAEAHTEAPHHHSNEGVFTHVLSDLPDSGYIRKDNTGEGYESSGWIFDKRFVFDRQKLLELLTGLEVERLKGVFITQEGAISVNQADGVLSYTANDTSTDSRVEVIGVSAQAWLHLEKLFFQTLNHFD